MINGSYGMDPNKTKHYGSNFHTIDFSLSDTLSAEYLKNNYNSAKVGELYFAGRSTEVTIREIDRMIETLEAAKETIYKAYRLRQLK